MKETNLTKKIIDEAIALSPEKDMILWDSKLSGFGVKIRPTGKGSYIYNYTNKYGRRRRCKIGDYPPMTLQKAKDSYALLYASVRQGIDPAEEKQKAKQATTIKDLCFKYKDAMQEGRIIYRGKPKAPHTIKTDEGCILRHIVPLIGNKSIEELKRSHVEKMMHDVVNGKTAITEKTAKGLVVVTGGVRTSGYCVSLMGTIWEWGRNQAIISEELRNPCRGIEKPASVKRDRILTSDELNRFGEALKQFQAENMNSEAITAICILFLSGWRLREVLSLKQNYLEDETKYVALPKTKTGKQRRPLGETAWQLLRALTPNEGNYLFHSTKWPDKHLYELRQFKKICKRAKINDFRIHDIRHCFASLGAELGYSDSTIGGLIGHSGQTITSRYIQRFDPALLKAANNLSLTMKERLSI